MRFALLLFVSLALVGCSSGDKNQGKSGTNTTVNTSNIPFRLPSGSDLSALPAEVTVGLNSTMAVEYGSGAVNVMVKEIRDSRCPKGVNCVRAGEAIVTLVVSPLVEGEPVSDHEMKLLSTDEEPTPLGPMGFEVVRVDPYPTKGVQINVADYRATIRVSKR
ncbi:MAG: hypothetical protein HKN21_07825 [Candidatus Eisenbacteria bacterium]|uniref:Uncharacterized protein n=1 Tax=Eiseniibacteriota bacterium TaxID=2212470 RepID=A0A7Y2H2F2_UNCEI|nr:hypothetical protein [Candidatus Eisenbacteria bacterium]